MILIIFEVLPQVSIRYVKLALLVEISVVMSTGGMQYVFSYALPIIVI